MSSARRRAVLAGTGHRRGRLRRRRLAAALARVRRLALGEGHARYRGLPVRRAAARHGALRLLGEFVLIASLIAFGDMISVLRSGGSRGLAFGMHSLTELIIVATGACMIAGAR